MRLRYFREDAIAQASTLSEKREWESRQLIGA